MFIIRMLQAKFFGSLKIINKSSLVILNFVVFLVRLIVLSIFFSINHEKAKYLYMVGKLACLKFKCLKI